MTDKLTATMQIAQRVYSLAQEKDDPTLMIGAYRAVAFTFYFLGDFESALQYAMRGVQIWQSGKVQSHVEEYYTPVVGCLCPLAMCEWYLGEIASCQANIDKAISIAKELNDMHGLALALNFAAFAAHYERKPGRNGPLGIGINSTVNAPQLCVLASGRSHFARAVAQQLR